VRFEFILTKGRSLYRFPALAPACKAVLVGSRVCNSHRVPIMARDQGVSSSAGKVKGICPRGNNKVVIIIFHIYGKCLFLMLELY
jgi:hypothetical protein